MRWLTRIAASRQCCGSPSPYPASHWNRPISTRRAYSSDPRLNGTRRAYRRAAEVRSARSVSGVCTRRRRSPRCRNGRRAPVGTTRRIGSVGLPSHQGDPRLRAERPARGAARSRPDRAGPPRQSDRGRRRGHRPVHEPWSHRDAIEGHFDQRAALPFATPAGDDRYRLPGLGTPVRGNRGRIPAARLQAQSGRHGSRSCPREAAAGLPQERLGRTAYIAFPAHFALAGTSGRSRSRRTAALAIDSDFSGRRILRLRDEAQLLYVAAYWTRDLSTQSIHPTFITPLLDAIILLGASGPTMNWEQLSRWMGDDQATASLYLLLSCLSRHELISLPPGLLAELATRQTIIGRAENHIIQSLIDRYLLGGRTLHLIHSWHIWLNLLGPGARYAKSALLPWRIAFPPSYPHRFDLRAQAQRLARLIRRASRRVDPQT